MADGSVEELSLGGWSVSQWSVVSGLVEYLSVGRWSVVGDRWVGSIIEAGSTVGVGCRWPIGGWWFL